MTDKFRRDGTPYPEGDAGLFEWARDFEDHQARTVAVHRTLYGEKLSTVWLGLDHSFFDGPPLIFETMLFARHNRELQWRYSTEAQAIEGHRRALYLSFIPPPFRLLRLFRWIGPRPIREQADPPEPPPAS